MFTNSLILIEGKNLKDENLMISLGSAKQLIVGRDLTFGVVLSLAAESPEFLREALIDFSKIPEVTGVILMATRTSG